MKKRIKDSHAYIIMIAAMLFNNAPMAIFVCTMWILDAIEGNRL